MVNRRHSHSPPGFRKVLSAGRTRDGVVTVDMALCLPVLFLLCMASIDLIRLNHLRNVIAQATYEAARTGIVKGATTDDIQEVIDRELAAFRPGLEYMADVEIDETNKTVSISIDFDISNVGWIVLNTAIGDQINEELVLAME